MLYLSEIIFATYLPLNNALFLIISYNPNKFSQSILTPRKYAIQNLTVIAIILKFLPTLLELLDAIVHRLSARYISLGSFGCKNGFSMFVCLAFPRRPSSGTQNLRIIL